MSRNTSVTSSSFVTPEGQASLTREHTSSGRSLPQIPSLPQIDVSNTAQPQRTTSSDSHFNPYSIVAPTAQASSPVPLSPSVAGEPSALSPLRGPQTAGDPGLHPTLTRTNSGHSASVSNLNLNSKVDGPLDTYSVIGLPITTTGGSGQSAKQPGRFRLWWDNLWKWCQVHWLFMCFVSTVLCLVISIPVGWALRLHSFKDALSTSTAAVTLNASLISIDPTSQQMTIDWIIDMAASHCTDYPNTTISLYFDENLLRSSGSSGSIPSNNHPSTPVFQLNTSEALSCSDDPFANSAYFRTNIAIITIDGRTAQAYPFEKYAAEIFMFASLPDNATFPEVGILNTGGIAVGFNAVIDADASGAYTDGTYQSVLTITRGPVIRVYAIAIVIAVWLVTLTFLATCIAVVFLHRVMNATVLVLPIATLFAFTQLRATLPGAPTGFGADIDFVGILPCLAIITFCAVLMTGIFLFRNPESFGRDEKTGHDKEKQD